MKARRIEQFVAAGIASLALLFGACTSAGSAVSSGGVPTNGSANAKDFQFVVLHTNDHHGHTVADKNGNYGLPERATFIKDVEKHYKNVLILDAGDLNTGTPLSNTNNAKPDIEAYNMLGYYALTFGNHEFDKPFSVLEQQMKESAFYWTSANIKMDNGKFLGWDPHTKAIGLDKPYIIKQFDSPDGKGFKIGIVGLTTLRSLVIARPDKSLTFIPEIKAAEAAIKQLKAEQHPDFIIILGHLGDVEETKAMTTSPKLIDALHAAGLDVNMVVDGHSHTNMDSPIFEYKTPIVTAWEWGKKMGRAVIDMHNGRMKSFRWEGVPINSKAFPPDPAVAALLKPYQDKAAADLNKVVMTTAAEFPFTQGKLGRLPRYRETALGKLVTDGFMWWVTKNTNYKPDFALENGGAIRASLPAGDVTMNDLLAVLPFDDWVYVVQVPGSQIRKLFEFVPSLNQDAGGFPQFSEQVSYSITYDSNGKNGKIDMDSVKINGQPIDDNKTYTVVTNDYTAAGGDGYSMLNTADKFNSSELVSAAVVEYVKTLPTPVEPKANATVKVIGGVQP
jgi:5'-nucleotidase/UDP-sugar diphosphatase